MTDQNQFSRFLAYALQRKFSILVRNEFGESDAMNEDVKDAIYDAIDEWEEKP